MSKHTFGEFNAVLQACDQEHTIINTAITSGQSGKVSAVGRPEIRKDGTTVCNILMGGLSIIAL